MVTKPKKGENTWSQELVELLHKRGLPSTKFELIYHIFKLGKATTSKPDVIIPNGTTHIVSGKLGERQELLAYSTAHQYSIELAPVANLGEVFALTYPEKPHEKFHLHILANPKRPTEISLTLESLEEVADKIADSVAGRASQFEQQAEPVYEEAHRLLTSGATALGESMRGIKDSELEAVLGGHEFFVSLLRPRLKDPEMRRNALRVGAAFLFVSQALFYVLLSKAAQRAGKSKLYPPIDVSLSRSPVKLQEEYFSRVKDKDYEPIYGFDVSSSLTSTDAENASEQVIRAILNLAPRLDTPEAPATPGRVFQSMIPFEIRKPLGAHYTNPRAAILLARLAINSPDITVFDPACGSGTLLSASYRRKMELAAASDEKTLHRRFLEKDITGIDAMMFSAHLAAVNLALQHPLLETDYVRIGTMDSTRLKPGDTVSPIEATLPSQFKQAKLDEPEEDEDSRRKKSAGPVKLSARQAHTFSVSKVGLVIMNPPFTSWDNMAENYREQLNARTRLRGTGYGKILFWKISQQAHFILLADYFLEPEGMQAAILPLTTFTGRAFGNLVRFLVAHYDIRYLVVGLKQASFSEDTSLTECLLVATKKSEKQKDTDSQFTMIGLLKRPDDLTIDDIEKITRAAEDKQECDIATIRKYKCDDLLPERETLSGLLLRLLPSYNSARDRLDDALSDSKVTLVNFGDLRDEKVKKDKMIYLSRWVLGSEHFGFYGSKALVACRDEARAIKESDRLVFEEKSGKHITLRDRVGGARYRFAEEDLTPALRRFSRLQSIDISKDVDFVVSKPTTELEKVMVAIYGKVAARRYLARIREIRKNHKVRWPSRVLEGSTRLSIARRLDLSAPGTTIIATWGREPVFLATDGYMVKGTKDADYEKLLCLWFNSSPFLLLALGRLTVTRGSWIKFEEYAIERIKVPSPAGLDSGTRDTIREVFKTVSTKTLPSLLDQLEHEDETRIMIDDAVLKLIGVTEGQQRKDLAKSIRKGILDSLTTLKGTMNPEEGEAEEENDSD